LSSQKQFKNEILTLAINLFIIVISTADVKVNKIGSTSKESGLANKPRQSELNGLKNRTSLVAV
jgi:hypothetical protein